MFHRRTPPQRSNGSGRGKRSGSSLPHVFSGIKLWEKSGGSVVYVRDEVGDEDIPSMKGDSNRGGVSVVEEKIGKS